LVSVGDVIEKAQIIGQVGPYNVFDVLNNPYHDKNGLPTNRCNYWMSLTLWNKNKWHIKRSFISNSHT